MTITRAAAADTGRAEAAGGVFKDRDRDTARASPRLPHIISGLADGMG